MNDFAVETWRGIIFYLWCQGCYWDSFLSFGSRF